MSAMMNEKNVPDRRYGKPPVVEALCEILFEESKWDDTIPGLFYQRIEKDFPIKRNREIKQGEITMGPGHAEANVHNLPPWMQFISEKENRMIQIAENLLVINQLPPYPHFEDWEPTIYRALQIYNELTQPKNVVRIGLRYINKVVIPGKIIKMEDYFTIYPNLPKRLGDTHSAFLIRVEVPRVNGEHTILISFGVTPSFNNELEEQVFMLDCYDVFQLSRQPDVKILKNIIKEAHDNIVLTFEDSITDKSRNIFKMEDNS